MRISDGSSDVCYSDLRSIFVDNPGFHYLEDCACSIAGAGCHFYMPACSIVSSVMIRATFPCSGLKFYGSPWQPEFCDWAFNLPLGQIGRESCRERVCQSVLLLVGAVSLKKNKK